MGLEVERQSANSQSVLREIVLGPFRSIESYEHVNPQWTPDFLLQNV